MLSWIGTVTSIAGSFLVAFGLAFVGYILFILGSLSWLVVAIKTKNKALGVLNGTFFCANIIGLVNYWS